MGQLDKSSPAAAVVVELRSAREGYDEGWSLPARAREIATREALTDVFRDKERCPVLSRSVD